MHKYFPEWYQQAVLEPTDDELEKCWQGVETISQEMDAEQCINVVRLFFGIPFSASVFNDRFSESFQKFDPNFPMRDNLVLLKVLAGAVIVNIMDEHGKQTANVTALSTLCANSHGARPSVPISDVIDYAQKYIPEHSVKLSSVSANLPLKATGKEWKQTLEGFIEAWTSDEAEPKQDAISAPFQRIAKLINGQLDTIRLLDQQLQLQQEETDILWWVFSEYSNDLETPYADLDLPIACLVAGKELADLVTYPPGPRYAKGILLKVLQTVSQDNTEAIKLCDAINASDREWREKLLKYENLDRILDIIPIHVAASKSLETTRKTTWYDAFMTANGFKASHTFQAIDLAWQSYLERMLLRSLD